MIGAVFSDSQRWGHVSRAAPRRQNSTTGQPLPDHVMMMWCGVGSEEEADVLDV